MHITHVSFDVWNTLISANPEFALARTKLISDELAISFDKVRAAYTTVKTAVDREAEQLGSGYSTPAVYELLIRELGLEGQVPVERIGQIRDKVDALFLQHPPKTFSSVQEALHELHSSGITISVASNSNFISGYVMEPWLRQAYGSFSFMIFSDLLRVSKPHARFFSEVYKRSSVDKPTKILHIGDNPICDVTGATFVGMNAMLVESPVDVLGAVHTITKKEIANAQV